MDNSNSNEGALPRRCVEHLIKQDESILRLHGVKLKSVELGIVELTMSVTSDMVASQGLCQGGFIFTLGDLACAYACASFNTAPATTEAQISFISAAREGDELTAKASVEHRGKKVTHGKVQITKSTGEVVALYRASNLHLGPCIDP